MSDRWKQAPASTHADAEKHSELKAVTFCKFIVIKYDDDGQIEKLPMKEFAQMYDCGRFKVRTFLPPSFSADASSCYSLPHPGL